MLAINSSMRSIRAPLQAIARRQCSFTSGAAATSGPISPAAGHSNQKLAIAGLISYAAGVEMCFYYFLYQKSTKKEDTA